MRDRNLEDFRLWQIACALLAARDDCDRVDPANTIRRVIVNKRSDLVWAVGADGVHLGFDALEQETSRAFLGSNALLGASLHSVAEVESAAAGTIDYAHLAPIWDPLSKPATRPALGLGRLAAACGSGLPVLAQGGVDADHAGDAIRAGAAGVAVTGLLRSKSEACDAIRTLREGLDEGRRSAIG